MSSERMPIEPFDEFVAAGRRKCGNEHPELALLRQWVEGLIAADLVRLEFRDNPNTPVLLLVVPRGRNSILRIEHHTRDDALPSPHLFAKLSPRQLIQRAPKAASRVALIHPDLATEIRDFPEQLLDALTQALAESSFRQSDGNRRQPRHASTSHVRSVPVEAALTEGYEFKTRAQIRQAVRRESHLVESFLSFLKGHGRQHESRTALFRCDVFDRSSNILFEAKADASDRGQLRMAIGQLFDYSYSLFSEEERVQLKLCVLLPQKPPDDVRKLLAQTGIGVAYATESGNFREFHPG